MNKKKWEKPKLIVLVRKMAQEDILLSCKAGAGWSSGSTSGNTGCDADYGCSNCSNQTGS